MTIDELKIVWSKFLGTIPSAEQFEFRRQQEMQDAADKQVLQAHRNMLRSRP
jgi:hypothetical protein